jgi:hypothetical protein
VDIVTVVLIACIAVGFNKLFDYALNYRLNQTGCNDSNNVNDDPCLDIRASDISQSDFDFARSHHLVNQRINIDLMPNDINQYHANEHWKNEVIGYKADYLGHQRQVDSEHNHTASNHIDGSNVVRFNQL